MGTRATSKTRVTMAAAWVALVALTVAGCSHEAADWKSATLANTVEAYQGFAQQYPHSREAAEAQTRVKQLSEDRDWQIAQSTNTRDGYQQFLAQHPDSKWASEAKIRGENFPPAELSAANGVANASAAPDAGPIPAPANASVAEEAAAAAPPESASPAAPAASSTKSKSSRLAASRHHTHAAPSARTVASAHSRHPAAQWVQLGAFGSKARAESHWRQLSTRFTALKSLHPRYVAVRSRAHHVYRLQVHVSSAAAASGLCATLKRHAQMCMRVNA